MSTNVEVQSRGIPIDSQSGLRWTLTVLVLWFFVAVWIGVSGVLAGGGGPPIGLALAIGVPLILFAMDARLGTPLFGGLRRLDLSTLIAIQTFRVGGIFFVIDWLAGRLPGGFALPAGLGDLAIGATAPFVAAAMADGRPSRRALAWLWNAAGIFDLVTAVFLGVTHTSGPAGIFAGPVTTDAMARYPFSLIPTFLVPLAVMLHVTAFRALRRRSA